MSTVRFTPGYVIFSDVESERTIRTRCSHACLRPQDKKCPQCSARVACCPNCGSVWSPSTLKKYGGVCRVCATTNVDVDEKGLPNDWDLEDHHKAKQVDLWLKEQDPRVARYVRENFANLGALYRGKEPRTFFRETMQFLPQHLADLLREKAYGPIKPVKTLSVQHVKPQKRQRYDQPTETDDLQFRFACSLGDIRTMKELWDRNPDLDIYNEENFISACMCGHLEAAKWLLQVSPKPIDVHAQNDEALRQACRNGYQDVAEWLRNLP